MPLFQSFFEIEYTGRLHKKSRWSFGNETPYGKNKKGCFSCGWYGIVKAKPLPEGNGRLFEVLGMVEKPPRKEAPSNLAIIGRYILAPEIFGALEETEKGSDGEIQLTDGLRRMLGKQRILAYKFSGRRHDLGEKLGFLQATIEFALKNRELGPAFRAYLKSLDIDSF
jgi:UTP--glucose-1-phosphate uridylyltransferase